MLTQPKTGREVALRARTTFGRDTGNDVALDEPRASAQHAVMQWSDGQWTVRDLASRNGTWVQEQRIDPGEDIPLALGHSVAFGDPRRRWWLMSADPPAIFAESLARPVRVDAIDGVLGLPSNDDPRVIVYAGDRGWLIEDTDGTRPTHDRAVVVVADTPWRLALPAALDGTAALGFDGSGVRVLVTGSFERPRVDVQRADGWQTLRAASCDRLLWLLTHEREDDDTRPAHDPDRGLTHVDLVARALGIDPRTVDVYVHRLRHRLGAHGVHDLIERRAGVGQLRLAFDAVEWSPREA
ncbi:MAG: FHA domain-containing protein [bacterium]|nr:FHA domain-containing protein [Myxococcales bacterium]